MLQSQRGSRPSLMPENQINGHSNEIDDLDMSQIELLLKQSGSQNLHKALILSLDKLKKFHKHEKALSLKVKKLEELV